MRSRRGAALALLVVVAIVVAVVVASASSRNEGEPFAPDSTAPDGTRAMTDLLARFGVPVTVDRGYRATTGADDDVDDRGVGADDDPDTGGAAPDRGTVLVALETGLDDDTYDALVAHARRGGTVVVASPDSPLGPEPSAALEPTEAVLIGMCDLDLPGVGALYGFEIAFAADDDDQVCVTAGADADDPAAVVSRHAGAGRIIRIGGPHVFTNRYLDEADNAVLVTDLLAGAERVVVVRRAPLGSGDRTLLELLPGGFWRMLFQLALALVLFVWASAIRLGRPVREPILWPLPGTATTAAVGQLYQRSGHATLAAGWLRRRLRRQLIRRYQLPANAATVEVAATVARAHGRPEAAASYAAVLDGSRVEDAAALVVLAGAVDRLRREERAP